MRRAIALSVVGLLLTVPSVSAPLGASPAQEVVEPSWGGHGAYAAWVVNERGRTILYLVEAFQGAARAGAGGHARVSRVLCRPRPGPDCPLNGRWHSVTPLEFRIDPTLSSAHLDVGWKAGSHALDWRERKNSDWSFAITDVHVGDDGVHIERFELVEARIKGQLFGREIGSLGRAHAYMVQGAGTRADLRRIRRAVLSRVARIEAR